MRHTLYAIALLFILNACASFEHKQPKLVVLQPPSKVIGTPTPAMERKMDSSCAHALLFIPVKKADSIDALTDKVIKLGTNANALRDVEIKTTNIFTFVYNVTCIEITGVPVNFSGDLL